MRPEIFLGSLATVADPFGTVGQPDSRSAMTADMEEQIVIVAFQSAKLVQRVGRASGTA